MDYIEKEFTYNGFNCVVTLSELGYRCGYVQIPIEHPLYDMPFQVINDSKELFTQLSYAGSTFPKDGYGYWIGFTCDDRKSKPDVEKVKEIFGDKPMVLTFLNMQKISFYPKDGEVRTVEYVTDKLKTLVNEVIDYGNRG